MSTTNPLQEPKKRVAPGVVVVIIMVLALAAIQRGEHQRSRIWLMATALLGMTFIGGQVYDFTTFVHEGLNLSVNTFGSAFFVLTGFHGAHVTGGVIWLLGLWYQLKRGRLDARDYTKVEIAGLYWHFVDIVWVAIFTIIYLIP